MKSSVNEEDYTCEICGNEGYKECLVICSSCAAHQHMYCMVEVAMEAPNEWQCEECYTKIQDHLAGKGVDESLVEHPWNKMLKVSARKRKHNEDESDDDDDDDDDRRTNKDIFCKRRNSSCANQFTPPPSSNVQQNILFSSPKVYIDLTQSPSQPMIDGDEIDDVENTPIQSAIVVPPKPNEPKIRVVPDGKYFDPDITRPINKIVTSLWRGHYLNWNQVPQNVKEMWWCYFKERFEWDTIYEADVHKLFKRKVGAKIRNFITRAKEQLKRPSHVTIEDWDIMKVKFADPKYIDKCKKAQSSRHTYSRSDRTIYRGGSINLKEYRRRMDGTVMEQQCRKSIKIVTSKLDSDNTPKNVSKSNCIPSSTSTPNPSSSIRQSIAPSTNIQPITSEVFHTQIGSQTTIAPTTTPSSTTFVDNHQSQPPSQPLPKENVVIDDGEIEPQTTNSKIFIGIEGDNFEPDITKEINRIVTRYWRGPFLNWNKVPQHIKDSWWARFAEIFHWDPTMEGNVNKMFKKKASAKIRNFVCLAKKNMKKPPHVTVEDWAVMKTNFDNDEYVKKCNKAQGCRKKYTIDGGASYCGGSINAKEHRRRMIMELGRPPTVLETFNRTHKKKDGSWSGEMAAKVVETFNELHKIQETVEDVNEKKSEEEMWVQAAGGATNGRVFGLGYVGKNRMLDQDSTTSKLCLELLTMKETVANLQLKNDEKDKEIAKQKEILEKQNDAIKVQDLQQQNETKEKGSLQTQIDVLSSHVRELLDALHNSRIIVNQNLTSPSQ